MLYRNVKEDQEHKIIKLVLSNEDFDSAKLEVRAAKVDNPSELELDSSLQKSIVVPISIAKFLLSTLAMLQPQEQQ